MSVLWHGSGCHSWFGDCAGLTARIADPAAHPFREESLGEDTVQTARCERRSLRAAPEGQGNRHFERMGDAARIGWLAAGRALSTLPDDGGIAPEERGVMLGSAFGCQTANLHYDQFSIGEGRLRGASPGRFKGTIDNAVAGWIAVAHSRKGANATVVSGRTASSEALSHALRALRLGRVRELLVGGVERLGPMHVAMYGQPAQAPIADGAALHVLRVGTPSAGSLEIVSVERIRGSRQEALSAWATRHGTQSVGLVVGATEAASFPSARVLDPRPLIGDSFGAQGSFLLARALQHRGEDGFSGRPEALVVDSSANGRCHWLTRLRLHG